MDASPEDAVVLVGRAAQWVAFGLCDGLGNMTPLQRLEKIQDLQRDRKAANEKGRFWHKKAVRMAYEQKELIEETEAETE